MTLPSDPKNTNGGNSEDPLGGLDPLAWLESLAKRQGANPDELTTAADLNVPLPPPDTVIDEPGYTPGYDAGKSATSARPQPPAPMQPPVSAQPLPPVQSQPPTPEPAPAMDASDPFGGLDPMAWMESLAKRQGANPDELTTAADLNVPMPPPDTVIDEPGYTPGYDVRKPETPAASRPSAPTPTPAVPIASQPPLSVPVQPPTLPPAAPEPVPAMDASDPFGGLDPMAWMESLAKRQGANPDELTTAADLNVPLPPADTVIDEPGYTPGYDVRKPETPAASRPSVPAPEPVQPPVVAQQPTLPLVQPPLPTPEPVAMQPEEPVAAPEPAPALDAADPFATSDPMAWMESLAKRQGANPEELMTAADLNIPMPPADSVIDEPGYTDYSPFAVPPANSELIEPPTMSPAEAEALLGITASAPEANPLSEMDPLTWLESLAAPQAAGGSDFSMFATPTPETSEAMEAASALSWLEQLAREAQSLPAAKPGAEASAVPEIPAEEAAWADTTLRPAEEAGGMSNDMAEIQQWLAAQADSLAQVHELDQVSATEEDIPPAVPGELPEWLRDQMGVDASPITASPRSSPLVDELAAAPIPADLPDWLLEGSGLSIDDNLNLTLGGNATEAELPTGALTPEAEAAPDVSSAELEALVTPGVDEASDPWIEAFEFEEGRKKAGDESIPDWYTEALQQYGDTTGVGQLEASVTAQSDILPPGDIPSWLSGLESESATTYTPEPPATPHAEEAAAIPGDIPAWLLGAMPDELELSPSGPPTPGLGFDRLELADLPEWLRSAAEPEAPSTPPPALPEPTPAAVIVPPVAPIPAPVAVHAEPPPPTPVSQPVMAAPPQPVVPSIPAPTPIEHTQRLQQARTLVAQQQYKDSLPHYQSLIDSEVHLDDVISDMQTVIAAQPNDLRSRRLLGDAHLRKGNLQSALDAYRSALDQL
ncbi:MAG: tetratricopeptide repeat protein [Aggregatilineales bacterium]